MNNILSHSQFQPADGSARQKSQLDLSSAAYAQEMSVKARQSTSSDLVIETREGDRVTLSASSFSQLEAYSYTSEGIVRTESGAALYSLKERQMTLASGERFSFAVEGDLSENELEDIEAILKGLDGVLAEMKKGDMKDALERALEIGSFDSVASYSADLNYSASYEMRSSTAAMAEYQVPGGKSMTGSEPPAAEGNGNPSKGGPRFELDRFFDKLFKQLQAHDNQLLKKATSPIDQLFKHHLDRLEGGTAGMKLFSDFIEEARQGINLLFDTMTTERPHNGSQA